MRAFESGFTPPTVGPPALAGQYTWYDDGWPGTMRLWLHDARLVGRYTSHRFGTSHRVTADLDGHELRLDIHDFNGLDAQRFTGYLATEGRMVIAGVTQWRDERFGFYAYRGVPRALATFRPGDVAPGDFAGAYTLRCDTGPVSIELTHDGDRGLAGQWRHRDEEPHDISGAVEPDDPLLVRLTLLPHVQLSGYMFSRPKNVVTGWLDLLAGRRGCYLVRIG
jgi:hypothetical protein